MTHVRTVFAQLVDHLPYMAFYRQVARYQGDYRSRHFSCWDQLLCLLFAQLAYRESLRDIVHSLHGRRELLYAMGITGRVSRSTLADAGEKRDWRIYEGFARKLIAEAQQLYAQDPFGENLQEAAFALDSTTIDLCLSLFPWAEFRRTKAAIKLHTLLDLRGSIPTFVRITPGKVHDVRMLDQIPFEPGAIYVMDRGYLDFGRLYRIHTHGAFFVIRAKRRFAFQRRYSRPWTKPPACEPTRP
jgi:hypothetical protein